MQRIVSLLTAIAGRIFRLRRPGSPPALFGFLRQVSRRHPGGAGALCIGVLAVAVNRCPQDLPRGSRLFPPGIMHRKRFLRVRLRGPQKLLVQVVLRADLVELFGITPCLFLFLAKALLLNGLVLFCSRRFRRCRRRCLHRFPGFSGFQ